MAQKGTSTLLSVERSLRPLVLLLTFGCAALAVFLLASTLRSVPPAPWIACAILAALPALSNLHYLLTHELTTIGMIPVALLSLISALVLGLLGQTQSTPGWVACLAGLVALAGVAAVFALWLIRLRRAYQTNPPVSDTAYIIVLGGAIKNGRPCQTLARRLDIAARYWRERPTRTLVVSGGPTPDHATTEADVMARYLREQGVDPARIVLERQARNTHENIALSCKLLDEAGSTDQRCVVSSDYHLYRALRDARAIGVSLTPIAAPTPPTSAAQQWCREVLTVLFSR